METLVRPRKDYCRTLVLDGGVATADIGAAVRQHQAADDLLNIGATAQAIAHAVWLSAALEQEAIEGVIDVMTRWILNQEIVRLVAAGRMRLAAAMAGNRLCHAGARVVHIYDITPLPHTDLGGSVLACSASGQTSEVLQAMAKAHSRNEHITIVGVASAKAAPFRDLCHHFVGIHLDARMPNPLKLLASWGEHVGGQLLDAMVSLAVQRAGLREEDLRHENLGPTGPYDRGDWGNEDLVPRSPYDASDQHGLQ